MTIKQERDTFKYNKLAGDYVEYLNGQKRFPLYHAGRFYTYDGTRYVEDAELDQSIRTFFKKAKLAQSNNIIGNVSPIVKNLALRSRQEFPTMPFYTGKVAGGFAKTENIIAYRNGILDLERYLGGELELLPHTPKWASTVCLPYDFTPTATCPTWIKFLSQVFEDDQDRIALQQEWMGYLLAQDISQHKLMCKVGVSRAGKGTSMRIEAGLVGAENNTGFNLHSLAEKFGLRQLVGKLVAFVGEVNLANCRDKYRILETLNSVVGGDPVSVEEKHNPLCQSITLPTRFVLACNEMPSFVDPSGALAARLLILDYQVSFEGREDRQLDAKLMAEISGISNWALIGYARLKRQGRFTESARMTALVNRFRRDNSEVLGFVQDSLVVERQFNPGNLVGCTVVDSPLWIGKTDLETAYARWCNDNNKEPNLNWLGRNLRSIIPKLGYDRNRKRYEGVYLADLYRAGSRPPM